MSSSLNYNNKLLKEIHSHYGYDFTNYSSSHINRRLKDWMSLNDIPENEEYIQNIITNKELSYSIINHFSINVTQMFRNPDFFLEIRKSIIPILKTFPYIKIWHAGCATGEEVYSLAIILKESNLYDRCRIYATDYNEKSLQQAKEGIYSIEEIKKYTRNYIEAGGSSYFSDYYNYAYDSVAIDQDLNRNIVWANHNLVTNAVFNEMHLILCRNVLIYFNRDLHDQVTKLFHDSLIPNGILALGSAESLQFGSSNNLFKNMSKHHKIYKKIAS